MEPVQSRFDRSRGIQLTGGLIDRETTIQLADNQRMRCQLAGQLRQNQAARAHRRAAAALRELRRAQDQLKDPVQTLDAVLREAAELV